MSEENVFNRDMTIGDAMAKHPRAKEVFAGFHLGGCAHCGIADFETIGQVCEGYGVPVDELLNTLETLVLDHPVEEKKDEEKN
jgi:hybrid cluster-associated redox disulfide protein